jgi:DNA repair protein RadC
MTKKELKTWEASEVAIAYKSKSKGAVVIRGSKDAERALRAHPIYTEKMEVQEVFSILLLDRSNKVLGINIVSMGGINQTLVDTKLVFSVALKALASSIILCHNHPSGNVRPSTADIQLTEKLRQAGQLLDISVLDHLILTADSYKSFADEGIL